MFYGEGNTFRLAQVLVKNGEYRYHMLSHDITRKLHSVPLMSPSLLYFITMPTTCLFKAKLQLCSCFFSHIQLWKLKQYVNFYGMANYKWFVKDMVMVQKRNFSSASNEYCTLAACERKWLKTVALWACNMADNVFVTIICISRCWITARSSYRNMWCCWSASGQPIHVGRFSLNLWALVIHCLDRRTVWEREKENDEEKHRDNKTKDRPGGKISDWGLNPENSNWRSTRCLLPVCLCLSSSLCLPTADGGQSQKVLFVLLWISQISGSSWRPLGV